MEESFVHKIVNYLEEQELNHPDTMIIVPSQRMIAYLHRALFQVAGKPVLSPKIVTIDRWVEQLVPLPVIEKTHLLFELYELFRKNPVEAGVTGFDSFLVWGQTLVSDFEEIDRYLIPSGQLFKNLRDIREIENWSFHSEELSIGQQKFMAFWEKLHPYYSALEERLKVLNLTTKAKAYKQVAEEIDLVFKSNEKAQFVFAGFNALSESEIRIMKQLFTLGRGHILMDSDQFYLKDKWHEAGQFQRVLLDRLGVKELPFIRNELEQKSMRVQLVECAQFTAQAQAIGFELAKIPQDELQDSLVLLANEQLLSTMLQHIPAQLEKANITLGLPLQQTVLKSWNELIFRIQESFQKRQANAIYYKDFIHFIHHPFILNALSEEEKNSLYEFETQIVSKNWQFVSLKRIPRGKRLQLIFKALLNPWNNNWGRALEQIQALNRLIDRWLDKTAELERALIRKFAESVQDMMGLLERPVPEFSLQTFRSLFNQHWANESIAYFGNPLDGLQIMGLLETRGIDFKNIFVLGLNEGDMPPSNPIQTLIPMDLRRFFGLPTPREKQGLFAHHFYRLLHCCEHLFITYSGSSEAVGANEPSRYVQQIRLELARINRNIEVEQLFLEVETQNQAFEKNFPKQAEHLEALDALFQNGMTFSQLEKYMRCPLDFYYRYLLQFKDDTGLEEELEATTMGTILHSVMENLYKPYLSTASNRVYITPDVITTLEKKVPLLLDEAFKEHYSDDIRIVNSGTNHIFYLIAGDIIRKWLYREKLLLEENPQKSLEIIGLEQEYVVEISPEVRGNKKQFRLKGIIDRIDRWGDDIRILDYKSGKVESSDVSLKARFDSLEEIAEQIIKNKRQVKKDYALQLLMYCYLYYLKTGIYTDQSGIISFNSISNSPYILQLPETVGKEELMYLVEWVFGAILDKIYDPEVAFKHNPNNMYCKYCH